MTYSTCKQTVIQALMLGVAAATVAGCSSGMMSSTTTTTPPAVTPPASVISQLATTTMIGSTVDVGTGPGAGDTNPYGLTIVPSTVTNTTPIAGTTVTMSPGDLVVCNFNNASGTAGAGTTIEDIKPVAGSKPVRISQSADYAGCNSIALNPTAGYIWLAAYTANDNPIVSPAGTEVSNLKSSYAWAQPWGQVFGSPTPAAGSTATPPAAFYVSDAMDGSIVQALVSTKPATYSKIISGFPVSVSATYGVLAPAGLTYDPSSDTLYVVSSDTSSVLAFSSVSTIPANGITITFTPGMSTGGSYPTTTAAAFAFSGPNAAQAKVIFSGTPLNYPVSSALLYNGDLVVGNTGDNNLVEIQPSSGTVLGTKSVDSGAAGAIFGIATSGTTLATQKIYYNNDNTATVNLISQ